jgi:hypothetical protein
VFDICDICSDEESLRGNASGLMDAPGIGNLHAIVNNLREALEYFGKHGGPETTGLLGPRVLLSGMTELKKQKDKQVCPGVYVKFTENNAKCYSHDHSCPLACRQILIKS